MKNFNLSQFLGCCVISIGIIIAGWMISQELPNTTSVPTSFSVTTHTQDEAFGNYLSKYEVSAYLNISNEDVEMLLDSGKLEGTYTVAGTSYVFSREKLDEWVAERIG